MGFRGVVLSTDAAGSNLHILFGLASLAAGRTVQNSHARNTIWWMRPGRCIFAMSGQRDPGVKSPFDLSYRPTGLFTPIPIQPAHCLSSCRCTARRHPPWIWLVRHPSSHGPAIDRMIQRPIRKCTRSTMSMITAAIASANRRVFRYL